MCRTLKPAEDRSYKYKQHGNAGAIVNSCVILGRRMAHRLIIVDGGEIPRIHCDRVMIPPAQGYV